MRGRAQDNVTAIASTGTPSMVPEVLRQHADETATLWVSRRTLTRAPHVRLAALRRHDGRIAAHIDGLLVAGEQAWPFCEAGLESGSPGAAFAAAVWALEAQQHDALDRVFAAAEGQPELLRGLRSAFGWVEGERLRGVVADLLRSSDPERRSVGLAACAMHSVDPGAVLGQAIEDAGPGVRIRALRSVGELGRRDLASACVDASRDDDPDCRFWGAWSAVLLGDRGPGLAALTTIATEPGLRRAAAFRLAVQAMSPAAAHQLLHQLSQNSHELRWLIEGSGIAGEPSYVPWLIGHMENDRVARLAGEAFSLITGADLVSLQLERLPPENVESGPTEDPEDTSTEMDPDDGLPWPDPGRVEAWWSGNRAALQSGTRYFAGAPVRPDHCLGVLRAGTQRERILAAHYRGLLAPGTALFNTSAPAWRQQRMLASLE